MIYLIGGPPRAGKTTLARKLLAEYRIPFVPTDALVHMLKHAAEDLGVTDQIRYTKKARRFEPFLDFFIKYVQHASDVYTIEGDVFLPEQVTKLQEKYPVRACFLGTSELTLKTILQHDQGGWVADLPESDQQGLAKYLVGMSDYYRAEAEKYGLSYFDVSGNFDFTIEEATRYLLQNH